MDKQTGTKSAFIAVVGSPNVGKSSFINALIGQKVAIVSDKPQTTRTRILGVLTKENEQMVFVDTPGFHRPRNILGERMMKAVSAGLSDVDGVILITDTKKMNEADVKLIDEIKKRNLKAVLAINKIDLQKDRQELLGLIDEYTKLFEFDAVVLMSVRRNDGVDAALKELRKYLSDSPFYFPEGTVSDQPDRVVVSEIIREKILRLYEREIPHGIAIDIESFYEKDGKEGNPLLVVEATCYCEKENHKAILIGKNGEALKRVGIKARQDIEKFFGCQVALKIWVKVRENWRNKGGVIHSLGLD